MSSASLRVPASSANLGPGFDALGLALDLYLDCRITKSSTLSIEARGRDAAGIDCTPANLIWATACSVAAGAGRTLPAVHLEIANAIPLGKGLGSSAAALTAGVVLADHLLGLGWNRRRVLDEAARLEGHPDNVAACVLGGMVASGLDQNGAAHAVRLSLPPSVGIAVVVPDFALPTHEARAVLPDCYSREDAIFNIQRTALLLAALAVGDLSVFPFALDDRLHQPFRQALVPGLAEALALRLPGLLGCTLSGAGPSVLVFHESSRPDVPAQVASHFCGDVRQCEVLVRAVAEQGYTLRAVE